MKVSCHIGLLFNEPPGLARLLFIQSSETLARRKFAVPSPAFSILGHDRWRDKGAESR